MDKKTEIIKKLNQLHREKKISPYDKDRILKMPVEKAIELEIIKNTILQEEPEAEKVLEIETNNTDERILKQILKIQKEQLEVLEKIKGDTKTLVTWLVVIPVVLSILIIIMFIDKS